MNFFPPIAKGGMGMAKQAAAGAGAAAVVGGIWGIGLAAILGGPLGIVGALGARYVKGTIGGVMGGAQTNGSMWS